jgi:hypothetical protein
MPDNVSTRPDKNKNKGKDTPDGTTENDGSSDESGSGSGGGSSDPYQDAVDREKNYRHRAALRYEEQAKTLQEQAKALKIALGKKGFRAELKQKLQNVRLVARQTDAELMDSYRDRVGSLVKSDEDNQKSASAQTFANLSNAGRERANALSEAMLQGAGETDVLRAQGMALRNWSANQNEVGRAFFDTQTSINSALTDLTSDFRTARYNNDAEANADREMLWSAYYDQRSEAMTALGNTYGQMAEYYSMANEQEKSKDYKDSYDKYTDKSSNLFERASLTSGKAWENPGVSKRIRRWEGRDEFDDGMNSRQFGRQDVSLDRPEGATLRSWA